MIRKYKSFEQKETANFSKFIISFHIYLLKIHSFEAI